MKGDVGMVRGEMWGVWRSVGRGVRKCVERRPILGHDNNCM